VGWRTAALTDLTDISILPSPGPNIGDVLTWDGFNWTNEVIPPLSLGQLSDVYLAGPSDGQVLTYVTADGKWEAKDGGSGGGPRASTQYNSGGSDVTIDPTLGDVFFIYGITADFTLHTSSVIDGQIITIFMRGDSAGPHTVTLLGPLFQPMGGNNFFQTGGDSGDISCITFAGVGGGSAYYYETSRTPNHRRINDSVSSTGLETTLYDVFKITAGSGNTWTPNVIIPGQEITLIFTTSGTTSYAQVFGTGFKAQGNLATGTVSGKVFTVTFVADASTYNEISRTVAM
jgi:hypothetical protein